MTKLLRPKDHAEEMALFRAQVLGPVLHRELARGELKAELRVLSKRAFRPPGRSSAFERKPKPLPLTAVPHVTDRTDWVKYMHGRMSHSHVEQQ